MKNIAIYGAGGFGREVACLIRRINEKEPLWNLIGFFDDNLELKGKMISTFGPCFGGIDELNSYSNPISITIPIGNPSVIRSIVEKIHNKNVDFPNLIAPDATIVDKDSFQIGKGNIIQTDCFFSCNVSMGDFNIFNGWVAFGHDDIIGSYNTFMPATKISGSVTIGDDNFFGVGSIVLQQLKIGNKVRIGAGSVLMMKPKDGELYIGNPAVKFKFQ